MNSILNSPGRFFLDVSPNALNIQSSGTVVTVRTDIAYGLVVGSTVTLNDIPVKSWKADNRWYFIAKFLMDEVKMLDGLITGDYNTLVLYGYTEYEDSFVGSQDIKIMEILPKKG